MVNSGLKGLRPDCGDITDSLTPLLNRGPSVNRWSRCVLWPGPWMLNIILDGCYGHNKVAQTKFPPGERCPCESKSTVTNVQPHQHPR